MGIEDIVTAESPVVPTFDAVMRRVDPGKKSELMKAFDAARVVKSANLGVRIRKVLAKVIEQQSPEEQIVFNAFERLWVFVDLACEKMTCDKDIFFEIALSGTVQYCVFNGIVPGDIREFIALVEERL
ncbi:MAG: hypothetical protein ABII07_02140 [Patescibacteria group bacterium]|nr:hypothetical protein [Patescibacteria group bacterium]